MGGTENRKMRQGFPYLYKLLSLGLSYPEEKTWRRIEDVLHMSGEIFEGDLLSRVNRFREHFIENRDRLDDIKSEYLAIFDIGRAISPYETEYMKEKVSRKAFELADIAGFYAAFGLVVDEVAENKEALDHIAVELEFMALLAWKEHYAREKKQRDHLWVVRDARTKFVRDHLVNWGFFYCRRIYDLEGAAFYKRLADILEGVLILECERHHLDTSLFVMEMHREPFGGVRGEEPSC